MSTTLAASRAQAMAADAAEHFATKPNAIWMPGRSSIGGDNIGFGYASEKEAFPDVPAPFQPLGSTVLVMLRQPPLNSPSGMIHSQVDRKTERDNTQVARVIAVGRLAFCSRETGELWPEGAWCAVGDYVRVPKYQGDRMAVHFKCEESETDERTGRKSVKMVDDTVEFILFKDLAILGRYADAAAALAVRAYL